MPVPRNRDEARHYPGGISSASVTNHGDHGASRLQSRAMGVRVALGTGLLAVVLFTIYQVIRLQVLNSAPVALQQAEQALRDGDNARAREILQRLRWFAPNDDRVLLIIGVSLNADRRFAEAAEVLGRISEANRQFEEAGIALAASLISDGQLERAESVLHRLSSRYPQSRDCLDRLVRLHLQELRQRDAIALLMNHWKSYPHDLSVLPDLLELQVKQAAPHERVVVLEAANERHPQQSPVVLALARAYAQMGLIEKAQQAFAIAFKLRPKEYETRCAIAEFALDTSDLEKAKSLLESEDHTLDDHYWWLRSRVADQSGDPNLALEHLAKARAVKPYEERYVLLQAGLLRKTGRNDEAAEMAQKAVQLAEVRMRLMKLSNDLDREHPNPEHCLKIAEGLDGLGQHSEAMGWRRIREHVLSSGSQSPRDAESFLNRAQ